MKKISSAQYNPAEFHNHKHAGHKHRICNRKGAMSARRKNIKQFKMNGSKATNTISSLCNTKTKKIQQLLLQLILSKHSSIPPGPKANGINSQF